MATKFYNCDYKKGMLPYGNVGKERVKDNNDGKLDWTFHLFKVNFTFQRVMMKNIIGQ